MRTRYAVVGCLLVSLSGCEGCEGTNVNNITPADIRVSPSELAFGRIPVGIPVDRTITITNQGEEDLVVLELALRGDVAAFEVLDDPPTIPVRGTADVRIQFTPPQTGNINGTVLVRSNDGDTPEVSVALTGEGIPRTMCGDCDSPPTDYCATTGILIVYEPMGLCVMGECRYDATRITCVDGCDPEDAMCMMRGDAGMPIVDAGVDAGMDSGVPDAAVNAPDAGMDPCAGPVFTTPGECEFVVPQGVTSIQADLWGGGGAGGNQNGATGGGGAFVRASVPVTPGETLVVMVAEGGWNPGFGGGASAILRGLTPLLIAAGGGGGGSDGCTGCSMGGGKGGAGGGMVGQAGTDFIGTIGAYCTSATGGQGGTQTMGGAGGTSTGTVHTCPGLPGGQFTGGRATGVNEGCDMFVGADHWRAGGGQGNGGGGGGGAGWFGGGGAGFIWTYCAGGGGGGSSYAAPSISGAVLQGGMDQGQANPNESNGAGRGGDVMGFGTDGRVRLMF